MMKKAFLFFIPDDDDDDDDDEEIFRLLCQEMYCVVLCLWFPFLVFTPSEVVCCANCTPSNPISLLLRADNTVHNVETILLRGVDIYCSTIEYKIPLCKVSLPYIPYTPHPNSIAERCTKFEESHF